MFLRALSVAVCLLAALAATAARADDTHKTNPGDDPDPSFLEFLGSVDRLSEVNPNYLSQPAAVKVARPAANGATRPPAAPPPAPAPPPSGDKNNG